MLLSSLVNTYALSFIHTHEHPFSSSPTRIVQHKELERYYLVCFEFCYVLHLGLPTSIYFLLLLLSPHLSHSESAQPLFAYESILPATILIHLLLQRNEGLMLNVQMSRNGGWL